MASIHPQFLNREDELAQIEKLVTKWGDLCVLIIDGPGGIGKSRLLEEAYRRRQHYSEILQNRLITSQVINMSDIRLQVTMNLGRRIADEIGSSHFQNYLERADQLTLLESKGLLTPGAFERYVYEGDYLFLEAYNAIAEKYRIFLIVDTIEAVMSLPTGPYLARMVSKLQNTFLLLAGRNSKQFYDAFERALEKSPSEKTMPKPLELKNFTSQTSIDYLDSTPVHRYLDAQPLLKKNLLLLTKGHPLSLALAAEWLRQDIPLPELVNRPPKELASLPQKELSLIQQEFESALVSYVRNLHSDIADLILTMAHFNLRFDADLLAAIKEIPVEESQRRIAELKDWFFVKEKPGQILVLHDEMQRLVEEYVWPEVDRFRTRRRQLSEKAISYYEVLIGKVGEHSQELDILARQAEEKGQIPEAAKARRKYLEQQRKRWLLTRELLHYTLDADLIEGYHMFIREFDITLDQYQPLLRFGLVQEMDTYKPQLPEEDMKYEVDIRIAQYYLDEAEHKDAYNLLLDLKSSFDYKDKRKADSLILLANAAIRVGQLLKGNQYFQEALEICQKYQLPEQWQARAENGLGWSYRLLGQWQQAIEHWNKAFEHSSQIEDYESMAQILNNLAYVYHLKGDDQRGLNLCQQGIEIAHSISMPRQIGAAYSTLGEIYLALNRYDEAFRHYNLALSIFEEGMDEEWQALIHHEISRAMRHQAFSQEDSDERLKLLHKAQEHARISIDLCERYFLQKDAPAIYYGAGVIFSDLGKLEEAKGYLEKSLSLNEERREHFGLIVNLSALAEIAYSESNYERVKNIAQKASRLVGDRAEYPIFYGRLLRTLALVQLDQGRYDAAMDTYIEALSEILRHGGYGKYSIGSEVSRLRHRILKLPDAVRLNWIDQFIKKWQSDATRHAPEIITGVRLTRAQISRGEQ